MYNTWDLKGYNIPHPFDVGRELEICMLINMKKERSTIFIYLFGELTASTLESYKYKQKFRLKRSKENQSILLYYIELLVGLT